LKFRSFSPNSHSSRHDGDLIEKKREEVVTAKVILFAAKAWKNVATVILNSF
jgi:hypothetical protein